MSYLIVGDLHLDRNLPHSKDSGEGNDRYKFRKELFAESIKGFNTIFLTGDVTHRKDLIDGQLMHDFQEIVEGKNVVHVLGNHDWSGSSDQKSMGQLIARNNSRYLAVTETESFRVGPTTFVLTSYYATEEEIVSAVESKADGSGKVIVIGHWNFWTPLMGGKKIPMAWAKAMAQRGVEFILGHIHPPAPIEGGVGAYIGVLSPIRFGESQGYMLEFDPHDGTLSAKAYPFGEEFLELHYTERSTWAFKHGGIENKYIKVFYDPRKDDVDEVRQEMAREFEGCRRLLILPDLSKSEAHEDQILDEEEASKLHFRVNEEDYIREAAEDHDLKGEEERLIAKHREIKGMVN